MTHSCLVESRFKAACPSFFCILMCVNVCVRQCVSAQAYVITSHACPRNCSSLYGFFTIWSNHFMRIWWFMLRVWLQTFIWWLVNAIKKYSSLPRGNRKHSNTKYFVYTSDTNIFWSIQRVIQWLCDFFSNKLVWPLSKPVALRIR